MEVMWAIVVGLLYAAGLFMLLRRSILKIIIGLGLIGYAANILIFTVARLNRAHPPLIPHNAETLTAPYADPVPQALVLTSIVIGFSVQAFAVVLFKRVYRRLKADDIDQLRSTDQTDPIELL